MGFHIRWLYEWLCRPGPMPPALVVKLKPEVPTVDEIEIGKNDLGVRQTRPLSLCKEALAAASAYRRKNDGRSIELVDAEISIDPASPIRGIANGDEVIAR